MDLANCYLFIKKERSVEQNKEPKKKERKIDKNKNKNIEIDGLFYRGEKKKKDREKQEGKKKDGRQKKRNFFSASTQQDGENSW